MDVLHNFAAPTGARASILLMTGGLVILGFLFLAWVFRSAIVGDLAPTANVRNRAPRVHLPPARLAGVPAARVPLARAFPKPKKGKRKTMPPLDAVLDHLHAQGLDARILQSRATWKVVRLYQCPTCLAPRGGACEAERGVLADAFELLSGEAPKVRELRCRQTGDDHCEFEVHHVALRGRVA